MNIKILVSLIFVLILLFSNYLYKKRLQFKNKNENKLCDWCIKPYLLSDKSKEKEEIHNDFFELIKSLNIPWQLQYGSLLGAIRNHGPIKRDGDVDLILLPDKNDIRFHHKNSKQNDILNRRILLKLFYDNIKKNKRFNKFHLIINAYQKDGKKIYNSNVNYSDNDLTMRGYYTTISIKPINTKSKLILNYPYVFDISFKYGLKRNQYLKQFGNICNCLWNNKILKCPEGALKHVYGWYGPNFMESQKNIGTNKNRIYGKKHYRKELIKMNKAKFSNNNLRHYDEKYGIKGYTIK